MTSPDADPELDAAATRLAGVGFVKVSDQATRSFDDRTVEFVRGSVRVQILRDRGRHLFAVHTPIDGIFRGYGDWVSCATGEKPNLVMGSLMDEVTSLLQQLPKIEALLVSVDPSTLRDCLQATNRWRREERQRQGIQSSFER